MNATFFIISINSIESANVVFFLAFQIDILSQSFDKQTKHKKRDIKVHWVSIAQFGMEVDESKNRNTFKIEKNATKQFFVPTSSYFIDLKELFVFHYILFEEYWVFLIFSSLRVGYLWNCEESNKGLLSLSVYHIVYFLL